MPDEIPESVVLRDVARWRALWEAWDAHAPERAALFPTVPVTYYILHERTPVPTHDVVLWAMWFEAADRHVASTEVGPGVRVSTAFLGIDHNLGCTGPPELFETMIFGLPDDDEPTWRYATWAEAECGHAVAVAYARAALTPSACPPGSLCEACLDAPATRLQAAPWGGEMGVCVGCAGGGGTA